MSLSPDRILDAAAQLVEDEGLEALTMRRLAARLRINPMTIYLRFENKDELLDRLLERMVMAVELPPLDDGTWCDRALSLARAVRSHLQAHRHLMPALRSSPRITTAFFQAAETGLALMAELGFEEVDVVRGFRALIWNTIGLTLVHDVLEQRYPGGDHSGQVPAQRVRAAVDQLPESALPSVLRYLPYFGSFEEDELFEYTTGLLVAGLWAQRRRTPRRRRPSRSTAGAARN